MAKEQLKTDNDDTDVMLLPSADEENTKEIIRKNDLLKLTKLKDEFNNLKKKYGKTKLPLTSLKNKLELGKLDEGLTAWRNLRQVFDDERKQIVKPYYLTVEYWNTNYNTLIELIKDIELHHKTKKTELKTADANKKLQEEKERRELTEARQTKLIDAQTSFDGKGFSVSSPFHGIAEIRMELTDIGTMSEAAFTNIFDQMVGAVATIALKDAELKTQREERERTEQETKNKLALEKEQETTLLKKQNEELEERLKLLSALLQGTKMVTDIAQVPAAHPIIDTHWEEKREPEQTVAVEEISVRADGKEALSSETEVGLAWYTPTSGKVVVGEKNEEELKEMIQLYFDQPNEIIYTPVLDAEPVTTPADEPVKFIEPDPAPEKIIPASVEKITEKAYGVTEYTIPAPIPVTLPFARPTRTIMPHPIAKNDIELFNEQQEKDQVNWALFIGAVKNIVIPEMLTYEYKAVRMDAVKLRDQLLALSPDT